MFSYLLGVLAATGSPSLAFLGGVLLTTGDDASSFILGVAGVRVPVRDCLEATFRDGVYYGVSYSLQSWTPGI